MDYKRITIFAGHYGSGKTNISLNYACWLKRTVDVVICDLDIVNPYFRTLDGLEYMKENGIDIISSDYANTNVELPSIPVQAQSIFDNRNMYAVIDLGGDDRGALALGRYSEAILGEKNFEMLLVVNKYRPMTRDINGLKSIKEEIEKASRVNFTGIVNNSNLGDDTTPADIYDTVAFMEEVSKVLSLPVKMTTVRHDLSNGCLDILCDSEIFPIKLIGKSAWKIEKHMGSRLEPHTKPGTC